jgi:hypothetical protein
LKALRVDGGPPGDLSIGEALASLAHRGQDVKAVSYMAG